jgi:mono/diheme cytochrome c family protein
MSVQSRCGRSQRQGVFLAWGALLAVALAAGCAPQEALTYNDTPDLAEIPVRHQEQVRQILLQYFGTPEAPRLKLAAAEQASDAASGELVLEDRVPPAELRRGAAVYRQRCAGCHGVSGDGQGVAAPYLNPKPRNYLLGKFKFISTPIGSKPLRADLERIIRNGAKGTSMPSFRWLSDEDMQAVVDYVIVLSRRGEMEAALIDESLNGDTDEDQNFDPQMVADFAQDIDRSWAEAKQKVVMPVTPEPKYDNESILAGAKYFVSHECAKCHGMDGRGGRQNFKAEDTAKDAWGQVAFAADLTAGMLHGGRRPVDIYRRIYSGINGSVMPKFPESEDPKTVWNLTHFVISLAEGRKIPEVQALLENAAKSVANPTGGEAASGEAAASGG